MDFDWLSVFLLFIKSLENDPKDMVHHCRCCCCSVDSFKTIFYSYSYHRWCSLRWLCWPFSLHEHSSSFRDILRYNGFRHQIQGQYFEEHTCDWPEALVFRPAAVLHEKTQLLIHLTGGLTVSASVRSGKIYFYCCACDCKIKNIVAAVITFQLYRIR